MISFSVRLVVAMFDHRLHAVSAQIFDKENFACPS
jgi:hypothetical protein